MAIVKQQTLVQSYLQFNGRTEEALAFYGEALGAEVVMMMRFKDNPEPCTEFNPQPEHVMHACFRVGATEIMASDGCGGDSAGFQGFSLSLSVADTAAAERAFQALSQGGQVQMPLAKTFWSPLFGMVADKFGVNWMVMVAP